MKKEMCFGVFILCLFFATACVPKKSYIGVVVSDAWYTCSCLSMPVRCYQVMEHYIFEYELSRTGDGSYLVEGVAKVNSKVWGGYQEANYVTVTFLFLRRGSVVESLEVQLRGHLENMPFSHHFSTNVVFDEITVGAYNSYMWG